MERLNEKKWMPAVVDEVFDKIEPTKGKTTGELLAGDDVPYIAAAKTNNGCAGVFSSSPYNNWVSDGNAIVFVQLGDGAAGLAHYLPMPFIGMNGKTSCGYSEHINAKNGVFIARCLSANKAIFSHGHSWTGDRLKKTRFMLPVDEKRMVDYKYIEQYSSKLQKKLLKRYKTYVEKQIENLEYKEIPNLDEKEWRPIAITDLFQSFIPGKGKGLNHLRKCEVKGIDYIGATNRNNGVLCYIEENEYSNKMLQPGKCIGFIKNGDGAAGFAIYKEEQFVSTSDVLYGYAEWINRYTGLFFVVAQDMIEAKYSHGYKRNKQHLSGDKVMLPVDNEGKPDYKYMEQYTKNLILKKYKQYISFLDKKEA